MSGAIKSGGSQRVFGVPFNNGLVRSDRAFEIAFFFGSLRDLIDLGRIAAYRFLARRHVLRLLARSENDRGPARFGYKKHCSNEDKNDSNKELHSGVAG